MFARRSVHTKRRASFFSIESFWGSARGLFYKKAPSYVLLFLPHHIRNDGMATAASGLALGAEAVGRVHLALGHQKFCQHGLYLDDGLDHQPCHLANLPLGAGAEALIAEVDELTQIHLNADL